MKRSAFSDIKLTGHPTTEALDQRLFGRSPAHGHEDDQPRAPERAHVAALPRNNARTEQRANAPTSVGDTEVEGIPVISHGHAESGQPTHAQAQGATSQGATARVVERHSHDIFKDQVRWMNRLKLDLEERYGAKVTGNAMVQLALDLFRDDFDRRGQRSRLFSGLVQGDDWRDDHDADDASARAEEGTP